MDETNILCIYILIVLFTHCVLYLVSCDVFVSSCSHLYPCCTLLDLCVLVISVSPYCRALSTQISDPYIDTNLTLYCKFAYLDSGIMIHRALRHANFGLSQNGNDRQPLEPAIDMTRSAFFTNDHAFSPSCDQWREPCVTGLMAWCLCGVRSRDTPRHLPGWLLGVHN